MLKKLKILGLVLICGAAVFSCANREDHSNKKAASAVAVVNPTEGNHVNGRVTFTEVPDGVLIKAEIKGLTPGSHGFHIHEFGDCSAKDASSAGGHYNPAHHPHGGPTDELRHVGDLGNIEADEHGNAVYERIDNVIKLSGSESIIGKSVIVHSDRDDLHSQPAGNAGKRVACGVIKAE